MLEHPNGLEPASAIASTGRSPEAMMPRARRAMLRDGYTCMSFARSGGER